MKLACAIAACALLLPAAGRSQTPAEPSAARLKLAHQIIEAQGGVATIQANSRAMMQQMLGQMGAGMTDDSRQALQKTVPDVVALMIPRILAADERAFATNFDEKQLSDIVAFYASPTGKALVAAMPQIGQQVGAAMSQMMPAIQLKILDRMCSQSDCPAPAKDRLAKLKDAVPADQRF